jgi:hypothetical protein
LHGTEFPDESDQARQAVAGRMRFAVLDFGIQ